MKLYIHCMDGNYYNGRYTEALYRAVRNFERVGLKKSKLTTKYHLTEDDGEVIEEYFTVELTQVDFAKLLYAVDNGIGVFGELKQLFGLPKVQQWKPFFTITSGKSGNLYLNAYLD